SEKLTYFIVAYPQKVVIIKSGEKDAEKRFLGYEFSNRRGSEGIHPIQRGKTIEECTRLFDAHNYDNPDKASTYVQRAFKGDFDSAIADSMQGNVTRARLVDMLTFDRIDFEKSISTAIKKKVTFDSLYPAVSIGSLSNIVRGVTYSKGDQIRERTDKVVLTSDNISLDGSFEVSKEVFLRTDFNADSEKILRKGDCFMCFSSGSKQHVGKVAFIENDTNYLAGGFMGILRADTTQVIPRYLFLILNSEIGRELVRIESSGNNINNLSSTINSIKIPLPPLEVQQKIVAEIEALEKKEVEAKNIITNTNSKIDALLSGIVGKELSLNKVAPFVVETTKIEDISLDTYITTDNMLQNKMGVAPFVGTPNISSITKYETNDILMSNIRPYLKKIWLSNREGGTSKDVLVFRVSDNSLYQPEFIYYMMRRDVFFGYVMEGKKGVKMPRGDKAEIMKYKMPIPSLAEQQKIVSKIELLENAIARAQETIDKIPAQKSVILKKYL
ncbi:MAG: restriction endonuclease subunit S, partial [Tannerella sp.]|nr:restriction endonuclease subunit S [Tannerella sp.]